jgi:hypothetical protein
MNDDTPQTWWMFLDNLDQAMVTFAHIPPIDGVPTGVKVIFDRTTWQGMGRPGMVEVKVQPSTGPN